MPSFKDLSGLRFGRLLVLRHHQDPRANTRWLCKCDCGQECVVVGSHLSSGHTESCGCKRKEVTSARARRHGLADTPTYYTWQHMIGRCVSPGDPAFQSYGGRGISVCERWLRFDSFLADMGVRPPGMTLDRIDNNKGYSPENCRWASRKTQNNNTRRNIVVETGDGSRMTLKEFSERTGQNYGTVKSRRLRTGVIDGAMEVGR